MRWGGPVCHTKSKPHDRVKGRRAVEVSLLSTPFHPLLPIQQRAGAEAAVSDREVDARLGWLCQVESMQTLHQPGERGLLRP